MYPLNRGRGWRRDHGGRGPTMRTNRDIRSRNGVPRYHSSTGVPVLSRFASPRDARVPFRQQENAVPRQDPQDSDRRAQSDRRFESRGREDLQRRRFAMPQARDRSA